MRDVCAILLVLILVLSGCASMTAEMAIPEALSGARVHPIENRRLFEVGSRPMFDFGPWQVTRFTRGWTREGVSDLFWTEAVDRSQRYGFILTGGVEEIDVVCEARADMNRWILPEIETVQSYELRCEGLVPRQEGAHFTLEVGTRIGHLDWMGERLLVIPSSDLKGSSWKYQARTGYVIEDDEGPISAVEVLRPGRIWMLDETVDELEDVVAAAASALLLYDNLVE